MHNKLLDEVVVVPSVAYASATGAFTATAVDGTVGADRAAHFVTAHTFASGATLNATIWESATSGGTYSLITGSAITQATAAKAAKIFVLDVPVNPSKPFQKVKATSASAAVTLSAVAVLYNGSATKPNANSGLGQYVAV